LTRPHSPNTISPYGNMEFVMRDIFKVMRALGDPTRVRIFKLLQHRGTMCVCELTSVLGLSQPAVSKSLKLLEDAGVVASERQGPWINYRLAGDNPYAAAISAHFREWLEDDSGLGEMLARARNTDRLTLCKRMEPPGVKSVVTANPKPPPARKTGAKRGG